MKKILLVLFLIIFLSCIGVYFFFSAKQAPLSPEDKMKAMKHLLGHAPILSESPKKNAWTTHTGKYVTFAYPAIATIYPVTENDTVDKKSLEIFMFQSESPKYFFGTEVLSPRDVHTYNDIPGVLMRRNDRNTYKETTMLYKTISFPVFTKLQENSIEKTAFILFEGREYTFSITSANPDVLQIFDTVLKSVQLQNY